MKENNLLTELIELWDMSHYLEHTSEMIKIEQIIRGKFSLDAVIEFNNHVKDGI